MTGPDVVADVDRQVTDDPAALADEAPVADPHHRLRQAFLSRHHPRGQRDLWTDHRSLADVDVALVQDRVGRKADDAVRPESAEAATGSAAWPDRRVPAQAAPRGPHDRTTQLVACAS